MDGGVRSLCVILPSGVPSGYLLVFQMGVPPDNSPDVAIGSSPQPARIKGPPQTPSRCPLCHRVLASLPFNSLFVGLSILPERKSSFNAIPAIDMNLYCLNYLM